MLQAASKHVHAPRRPKTELKRNGRPDGSPKVDGTKERPANLTKSLLRQQCYGRLVRPKI